MRDTIKHIVLLTITFFAILFLYNYLGYEKTALILLGMIYTRCFLIENNK